MSENEKVAVDLSTRCRHSGLLAYEIASALAAAEERGRRAGYEGAAKWHEERAARVEREAYSCPGTFLSDADRDYIAKRAQADRDDAAEIRALAPRDSGKDRK